MHTVKDTRMQTHAKMQTRKPIVTHDRAVMTLCLWHDIHVWACWTLKTLMQSLWNPNDPHLELFTLISPTNLTCTLTMTPPDLHQQSLSSSDTNVCVHTPPQILLFIYYSKFKYRGSTLLSCQMQNATEKTVYSTCPSTISIYAHANTLESGNDIMQLNTSVHMGLDKPL